ncbi:MAG: Alkaline phosphatase synthesis transcriptional regulatory protein phoP [Pseudomonadota bacterium]
MLPNLLIHAKPELTSKVLIAGQNPQLNELMEPALREAGYAVAFTSDGDTLLDTLSAEVPGLIVIDRAIPPMGGISLCRKIRTQPEFSDTIIIMISTNENISDRILGLDAGADDYLISPFNMEELLARVKSLSRRRSGKVPRILRAGRIEMDLDRWVVTVDGQPVNLTIKEARLLQELLEAKGRVLTRDTLLQRVWGHEKDLDINTRTVDVHIGRLRSKIDPSGGHIITVRNIGYRIDIALDWIKR